MRRPPIKTCRRDSLAASDAFDFGYHGHGGDDLRDFCLRIWSWIWVSILEVETASAPQIQGRVLVWLNRRRCRAIDRRKTGSSAAHARNLHEILHPAHRPSRGGCLHPEMFLYTHRRPIIFRFMLATRVGIFPLPQGFALFFKRGFMTITISPAVATGIGALVRVRDRDPKNPHDASSVKTRSCAGASLPVDFRTSRWTSRLV